MENDLGSERWLRCLLCKPLGESALDSLLCARKFVNDDTSHSGTVENQVGSNEHKRLG